jgi:hypothetical protein
LRTVSSPTNTTCRSGGTGDLYGVTWLVDGAISAVGVGMEVGARLAVGWRRVTD